MSAVQTPTAPPEEVFSEQPDSTVNLERVVIFKKCDNLQYLEFWLTKEMGFPIKVRIMGSFPDNDLFKAAFPGEPMGKSAVMVEFETEEGMEFIRGHIGAMKGVVAVREIRENSQRQD
ncbi:hypothetical protein L3Y34_011648 [Caenorhabditis briggsae]|uniref:Uncharacterized protein n=1 Tax=Caenorhabditis briggsae TaxID=6238 RepID=A0AAE9CU73_CAEBR|nr:hypothetical protein L3Y34_011648 [Caenorhabditis briggsae]